MKFPTPSQAAECSGPCWTPWYDPNACDCGLKDYPGLAPTAKGPAPPGPLLYPILSVMSRSSISSSSGSSGGIGFCGLLTVVFITLRLIGIIDWPWLWVLSPLWVPLAVLLAVVLVAGIIYLILAAFDRLRNRGRVS